MKIHSDILTASDIHAATRAAGMRGVDAEVTTRGSRSRVRSFNVKLTGTSNRRPNGGNRAYDGDDYAATWDEWGMFISALFEADPEAIVGQYKSKDAFHAYTDNRFTSLTAPYACDHRWRLGHYLGHRMCDYCSSETHYDALQGANA